jgi:hemerythrin
MNIEPNSPDVLGDPMLDRDHADLFFRVRVLLETCGDEAIAALAAVRSEARDHFEREDAELRRLGGNNAACHLDEHAAVLKSLDEVDAILRDSATPADMAQRLVASLTLELLRWLPEHVREMDVGLAAVRSQSRFGGAPLRITRPASSHRVAA